MQKETEKAVSDNYLSSRTLGYSCYANAHYVVFPKVLNGVLFTNEGKRVRESETLCPNVCNYHPTEVSLNVDYQSYEGTAILLGNIPYAFGHSFTDGFKSLWFLRTEEYRTLVGNGARPVLIIPPDSNKSMPPYWLSFLKSLNIDLRQMDVINSNTIFKNIIVPDLCWGYDETGHIFYTKE